MEMKSTALPEKWLKYEIMDFFGIRDISEVRSEIRRYPIVSFRECISAIQEDICCSQESVYVVKLVYRHQIYRLPNYLIQNHSDLECCVQDLTARDLRHFSEIWYCKNTCADQLAFGRVLFSLDPFFPRMENILIEIVWGGSARLIERCPNEDIPYVSLAKDALSQDWYVQNLICANREKAVLMDTVERIIGKLPDHYRSIKAMGTWMRGCGCMFLELEFFSNPRERMYFIDWDSDDDSLAIKHWKNIRMERWYDENPRTFGPCKELGISEKCSRLRRG